MPDGRIYTKRDSNMTVIDGSKTKQAINQWTRGRITIHIHLIDFLSNHKLNFVSTHPPAKAEMK